MKYTWMKMANDDWGSNNTIDAFDFQELNEKHAKYFLPLIFAKEK